MLSSASDAFGLVDNLIKREKNRMPLATRRSVRRGRGTPTDYATLQASVAKLNGRGQVRAVTWFHVSVSAKKIGSDYYYGGMVVERSANMHPALYYKGLLEAARRRGVTICSMTPVKSITRSGSGWSLKNRARCCRRRRCRDRDQRVYR